MEQIVCQFWWTVDPGSTPLTLLGTLRRIVRVDSGGCGRISGVACLFSITQRTREIRVPAWALGAMAHAQVAGAPCCRQSPRRCGRLGLVALWPRGAPRPERGIWNGLLFGLTPLESATLAAVAIAFALVAAARRPTLPAPWGGGGGGQGGGATFGRSAGGPCECEMRVARRSQAADLPNAGRQELLVAESGNVGLTNRLSSSCFSWASFAGRMFLEFLQHTRHRVC
jgi:hypothetical protein